MKKLLYAVISVLMVSSVLADGGMMDFHIVGGGMFGGWLLGIIYFAIGAFIFSVIFWLTYNWLVKCNKKR